MITASRRSGATCSESNRRRRCRGRLRVVRTAAKPAVPNGRSGPPGRQRSGVSRREAEAMGSPAGLGLASEAGPEARRRHRRRGRSRAPGEGGRLATRKDRPGPIAVTPCRVSAHLDVERPILAARGVPGQSW